MTTNFPVVVDSGTTLTYLPHKLANAINEAFDPPSTMINGLWQNDCSATPPTFCFRIGGADFHIHPSELLIPKPAGFDPDTGKCVSVCFSRNHEIKTDDTGYIDLRHPRVSRATLHIG